MADYFFSIGHEDCLQLSYTPANDILHTHESPSVIPKSLIFVTGALFNTGCYKILIHLLVYDLDLFLLPIELYRSVALVPVLELTQYEAGVTAPPPPIAVVLSDIPSRSFTLSLIACLVCSNLQYQSDSRKKKTHQKRLFDRITLWITQKCAFALFLNDRAWSGLLQSFNSVQSYAKHTAPHKRTF